MISRNSRNFQECSAYCLIKFSPRKFLLFFWKQFTILLEFEKYVEFGITWYDTDVIEILKQILYICELLSRKKHTQHYHSVQFWKIHVVGLKSLFSKLYISQTTTHQVWFTSIFVRVVWNVVFHELWQQRSKEFFFPFFIF